MESKEIRDFMYDMYDKSNIRDAKKFLLNSIDKLLENQMIKCKEYHAQMSIDDEKRE